MKQKALIIAYQLSCSQTKHKSIWNIRMEAITLSIMRRQICRRCIMTALRKKSSWLLTGSPVTTMCT